MEGSRQGELSPAARELVQANLALVQHIVNRVASRFPRGVDRAELAQVATMGLIEAAQRFDPERGTAFASYAGRRVEGSIFDAVRQMSWAPRSVRAGQRAIDTAETRLRSRLHRDATESELADELGVAVEELAARRVSVAKGSIVSLDAARLRPLDEMLVDSHPSIEEVVERREMHARIRASLSSLSDRHRYVIVGNLFEGRPMHELAEHLGVTRSRASQLKSEAIEALRLAINHRASATVAS